IPPAPTRFSIRNRPPTRSPVFIRDHRRRVAPYCANAFVVQMHRMKMSNLRIELTQPRVSRCIRAGMRSALRGGMQKIAKPRKLRLSVETIRRLQSKDLQVVHGGHCYTTSTNVDSGCYNCGDGGSVDNCPVPTDLCKTAACTTA